MDKPITFLKAISDKNRLLVLLLLKQHTLCVCDIQSVISLTQGALSIQLKSLTTAGLLTSIKRGKWVFYKLSDDISSAQKLILSHIFKEIENEKEVIDMLNKLSITETCIEC